MSALLQRRQRQTGTVDARFLPRPVEARTGAPAAVDRALRKNTEAASSRKGYDLDAQAIAKVLVRHYGDEAEAVLKRAVQFLDEARGAKR